YSVGVTLTPGTRQVGVTWNIITNVTPITSPVDSYGIYRSLNATNNFTPVATVPVTQPFYSEFLPTATAGVTYFYRVTARAAGMATPGQLSESPLIPTPDAVGSFMTWPNPPSGLSAASTVNQTILSWYPTATPEAVNAYTVYQNGVSLFSVVPALTMSVSIAENPGNLSIYQVSAQNAQGYSDLSQSVSVLVAPSITPVLVLTPPGYVPTPTQTPVFPPGVWIAGLNYGPSTFITGYNLYRQSVPTPGTTPTFVPIGSVNAPVSYFEDTGFVPGYVNQYQVVANNSAL